MQLESGEKLLRDVHIEANDTGRPAHFYLTDRRLVIEYDSISEAVTAIGEAALAGHSPLPLPFNWNLLDLAGAISVHRLVGLPVLKIMNGQGRATLWKSEEADALAAEICRARTAALARQPTGPPG